MRGSGFEIRQPAGDTNFWSGKIVDGLMNNFPLTIVSSVPMSDAELLKNLRIGLRFKIGEAEDWVFLVTADNRFILRREVPGRAVD
jgi:hypothetical protein